MVQWLRIYLGMQGTQVRSLVGEIRSHCHGATRESMLCNERPREPQQGPDADKKKERKLPSGQSCITDSPEWSGNWVLQVRVLGSSPSSAT